ncbi:MAG TPA: MFS transporter [Herpetosiphonaceae bacterium]
MLATLRQRNFALLWIGGLISITGNWMIFMALPLYVYKLTDSTFATSMMFLMGLLPKLLFGSVVGVFVDRWNRRQILIVTNLLFALALLPLLLVKTADQIWIVYAVQFAQSLIGVFSGPAEDALLPNLVGNGDLASANSLNAMNNNIAGLIGPPLGGAVIGLFDLAGVVIFDVFSFLFAGALIALISLPTQPSTRPSGAGAASLLERSLGVWREWLDGLQLVQRQKFVAFIFLMTAIVSLGVSIFSTLFFPFVAKVLSASEIQIGWLMAAQAIGGLVGSVIASRIGKYGSLSRILGFSTISLGVIDLVLFNYSALFPNITVALVLMLLAGVPGIINITCVATLIQTIVPNMYLGRVFATLGTTTALVGAIGTLLAGVLGDRVGIVTILNIQGIVFILVGSIVLYQLMTGGLSETAPADEMRPVVVEEGAV